MRSRAMHTARAFLKRTVRAPMLSPRGFAARAALIALVYALLHLAGLREYASFLCGTAPTGDPGDYLAVSLGVAYVFAHLAFLLVAPVLVIAAGIFHGLEQLIVRVRAGGRAGSMPAREDREDGPADGGGS